MPAARKLGKRVAPVEKRYLLANMRSPASPRIGTVSLGSLAWSFGIPSKNVLERRCFGWS